MQLQKEIQKVAGVILFGLLFSGCGASAPTAISEVPTTPPTASEVPTTPPTAEVPTVLPTAEASTALIPAAGPVCEAAFSAPVSERSPALPVFTLMKIGDRWSYQAYATSPSIEARLASEVKTLICIKPNLTQVGTYTDGSTGSIIDWDVRLVQWPEGKVINARQFTGGPPPSQKLGAGPAAGTDPLEDLVNWVRGAAN